MADKIVSWGGVDSKGTDGIGVTGSLTVSGNVGIGTATPAYKLEVSSTSGTGFGIMSGANSGAEINFQNRGYALPRWTIRATGAEDGSSGGLTFQRLASTFPVSITANENLLVGTTTDSARLTVKGSGTTSSTTALLVQNANASTSLVVLDNGNVGIGISSPNAGLEVANAEQSTFRITRNNNTGNYLELTGGASGGTYNINTSGTQAHIFQTAGTERVRITSNGNVGIGTVSPSASLHVFGNTIITGSLSVSLSTTGSTENTLTLGPAPGGGTGEGGQLGLNSTGGSYTSASFIDVYQDQFRILKGTNAGSVSGLMVINMPTNQTQFLGPVTASAFSGLPNDYLYATRSGSNQTVGSAWADTDIIFNNVAVSKGISFNTSTGVASLTGGKIYRVTARLAWSAAATYNLQFSCYTSANTQIGPTVEIIQSTNGTNNISDGTLEFIYAPSGNTDIKIRTTTNNNALSGEQIRADLNTQFIIQQIA